MQRVFFIILLLLWFVSCSERTVKEINNNPIADSLTKDLNDVYKSGCLSGFSVAIVNENGTVYKRGFGYADIENKKPYTENTIQNIASISKTLIGIALLKAQELGKLKLDDPIDKYLPFKVVNPYYPNSPITIRSLSNHTSSIVDNVFYDKKDYFLKPNQDLSKLKFNASEAGFNNCDSIISLNLFLQNLLTKKGKWYKETVFSKHKPTEVYQYSNIGATLAAYIIELATGESFDKFTETNIITPLKMNTSGWKFEDIDFSNYSHLYYTPDTLLPYYSMISYPDGNFITSSNDLGKYLTELIKGYNGQGILLTKESYKEFFREQLSEKNFLTKRTDDPNDDSYNVGIFIGFCFNGNIGHTGSDPGVETIMLFNPITNTGRLLITNTDIDKTEAEDEFNSIWKILETYEVRFSTKKLKTK